jgi:hypothetical protein
MFKRILLTLTFMTAFSTVGIGLANRADAWRSYYYYPRPYAAYYAPRTVYYGPPVVPYRAYYAPPVVRPYYAYYPRRYYYYPPYADYYYGPPSGVSVSVGY